MKPKRPNLEDLDVGLPADGASVALTLIASDQGSLMTSQQSGSVKPQPSDVADHRPPSWRLAQVIVRMPREKRRRLHQVALGLDKTVQDVFMEALDEYLETRGLRSLD